MKIGFVGVGNMGAPMACNLIKGEHRVAAFDLDTDAVEIVCDAGGRAAKDIADCVEDADAVITMLPAGTHVRAVYMDPGGIIDSTKSGTLLVDSSTIDVDSARAVAGAAAERGLAMLDAPVSGGVAGAQAGTLTFMVGGEGDAFARARPILDLMGKNIVHAGPSGNGQAAKICNNMILGISMIALSESFTLGARLGLEPKTLFEIASASSGSCWAMLHHLPVAGIVETSAANRDFKPGFATDMMLKDLRLAQQAAQATGCPTPVGAQVAALYGLFSAAGNGGLDYSAIIKLIEGQ